MSRRFGSARTALPVVAMLLGLALLAGAQQGLRVLDSGVTPSLATYGDTVTFWANVASPATDASVESVWIVYQFIPIMSLAETDTSEDYTTWQGDWTVPNLPGIVLPGDYQFFAVAISSSGDLSTSAPFVLSITDHDPRVPELLSPPDGAGIYRGMPIPFEWGAVPDATGYNFEIAFPSDATISIALPFFVTSFVVNPELAAELPDGEYRWRVQAVFGDENGGWADWFTFSKDSRHGPPMDCQGFVTSVNVDDGLLRVESAVWRREADGPGAWGCWMVHVTDDTVITKDGANISLADVAIGDYVYVEGWAANMGEGVPPCMDMVAGRIEVTDYSPPSFVSGSVAEIMPEERSFWLSEMTYDAKGPLERVLVRLTDNANLTRKGMPISFEDVRVGDFAVASGTWQRAVDGDDYFLASSVDFSFGNADWVYFEGTIERINHDDSTIVLSGTHSWGPRVLLQGRIVVSITRSTVISRNGLPAGFNDLMVGDSAFVEGRLMMQDQRPIPHDNELDPKVEASSIDAYSSRPNSN